MNRPTLSRTLFLTFPLLFIACPGPARNDNVPPSNLGSPVAAASPTVQTSGVTFDGDRAMENVRKQVDIGPRPAGSQELAKERDFLIPELKSYGLNVTTDEFHPKTPLGEKKMVNVIAELPGESSDVIMFSSHYDTKYFKEFRFVGADDGGSSTGTVMELARVLAANKQKPAFTYWFVFFDGEEAFCKEWDECKNPDGPDNTYGSRRFVAQLQQKNETKRVKGMILLDMMGYKDLDLGRDDISTPWLVDAVWQTARRLNLNGFVDRIEEVGGDDHVPFLKAGIDSMDIIQLSSYRYWHTPEDTLDKISPQSLKTVGDALVASLPKIEQHISSKRSG
jgi:glutaminyl-peptide cyclotransferase